MNKNQSIDASVFARAVEFAEAECELACEIAAKTVGGCFIPPEAYRYILLSMRKNLRTPHYLEPFGLGESFVKTLNEAVAEGVVAARMKCVSDLVPPAEPVSLGVFV